MTDNITTLIAEAREFSQLFSFDVHRDFVNRLADALEAEHKRAEEATFVSKRVYTDVLAERDRYRAALIEMAEVAKTCPSITTVDALLARVLNENGDE